MNLSKRNKTEIIYEFEDKTSFIILKKKWYNRLWKKYVFVFIYSKNLEVLSSRYLDPLSTVTFLTTLEITQLSESLREILKVQRSFLKRLERMIEEHSKVFSSEREDLVRVSPNLDRSWFVLLFIYQ